MCVCVCVGGGVCMPVSVCLFLSVSFSASLLLTLTPPSTTTHPLAAQVYSQGERRWLPSRASLSRSHRISNGVVPPMPSSSSVEGRGAGTGTGTGTGGKEGSSSSSSSRLRQHGPQDQPHHTRRDGADHSSLRISTRREPSLR